MAELLAARRDLAGELAPVSQELGRSLAGCADRPCRCRPGKDAIARDHRGIQPVGLGQDPLARAKSRTRAAFDDRDLEAPC
jgi:hypothetical protein